MIDLLIYVLITIAELLTFRVAGKIIFERNIPYSKLMAFLGAFQLVYSSVAVAEMNNMEVWQWEAYRLFVIFGFYLSISLLLGVFEGNIKYDGLLSDWKWAFGIGKFGSKKNDLVILTPSLNDIESDTEFSISYLSEEEKK